MISQRTITLALASQLLTRAATTASAAPFEDALVQSPSLTAPQRGNLAGTLSHRAFGPGDLARGAFSLPLPIDTPTERGPLLASVVPAYSPEGELGEWGHGWQANLAIRRFRPRGELDFAGADFTSPWGRLVEGDDGSFYVAGNPGQLRLERVAEGWRARTGDGTTYSFAAADAVAAPGGTYQWMLSRVDRIDGDATTLTWRRNASGRPFLDVVRWGGRGTSPQYQMRFDYESLAVPLVSYASGGALVLDRRIRQVIVEVARGTDYVERAHYDLAYRASPTGPAFYLAELVHTHAGGQAEPGVRYDYDFGAEQLAQASFAHVPGLDAFLAARGGRALQPDRAAIVDLEHDGLLDLESATDLATARQTATGFAIEPLPAAETADPLCRPAPSPLNKPRVLARLHGDAVEPMVVVTRSPDLGATTRLLICDRRGVPLADQQVTGGWVLGANTRLSDVDRDQRPDLVRVTNGRVSVLRNTSPGPLAPQFGEVVSTTLAPAVTPSASWLLDVNGDARVDLMVRHPNGLVVWWGLGGGVFSAQGATFGVYLASGQPLAGLANYQLSHGDYNNDGLTDLLLTKGQIVVAATNRGGSFVQAPVAALSGIPFPVQFPVIADLAGTGNEVAVFVDGERAMAIELTAVSTGLLRSADDGKGTVLRFGYVRATATPGLERRPAVLGSVEVVSAGYDNVIATYTYGAPVWHTEGKFLVGFDSATKRSPFLREQLTFFNDDDVAGVPRRSEDTDDRTPGIVRFTNRSYDDVLFHGIRWLRPATVEAGYRSTDGATTLSTTTRYVTYERGFCPTVTRTTGPSGELTRADVLAHIETIPDELHCQPSSQLLWGSHPDAALDFHHALALERNDLGQVTSAIQSAGSESLVLQTATYGADHRLAELAAPGRGTTRASYDAAGRLAEVIDPIGVAVRAAAIDPVTDAIVELHRIRPGAPSAFSYRYDGRERLAALWDDISGTGPTQPAARYSYRDVTAIQPGRIDVEAFADTAAGIRRRSVELIAADGETLVGGPWTGAGYALGAVSIATRAERRATAAFVGPRSAAEVDALTSAALRTTGSPLVDTTTAGFGHPIATTTTQQQAVIGTVTQELVLSASELVTRVHQPDGAVAETAIDAAGKPIRATDETGVTHRYRYDALGRLVRVDTPDGAHTLAFDAFGRPARITRAGLGTITYAYDPVTGLLVHKERATPAGAVVHAGDTTYDPTGRPIAVTASAPGGTTTVSYAYDGQLGSTLIPGQLGHLSRVTGDGWVRDELVDPLGRAYFQRVAIAGWRELTSDKVYRSDGTVAADTLTLHDAAGTALRTITKSTSLDQAGRIHALSIDDTVLYTLSYDAENRIARADFATGEAVVFDHDPVTHHVRGYHVDAPSASGGVQWDRDPRGLVSGETFDHAATSTRRAYSYDPRGLLVGATTPGQTDAYGYTPSGLPTTVADAAGSRNVHRTGTTLDVAGVHYVWDDAGRVIQKGDWTFGYGATGQLEHATRPGRAVTFVYDDAGQRIAKLVDGVPVRADLAGGVLTEAGFVEPVAIGGVVVGVLDDGVFRPLLADPRGTPFTGPDGSAGLASAFGFRLAPLGMSDVIDYAKLGRDPDLDIIRMGVRDYDPTLGQFWTPDPLYFEDLDKCQGSPIQCSLYGYAAGNPISFTDMRGTDRDTVGVLNERRELPDLPSFVRGHMPDHRLLSGDQLQTPIALIQPELTSVLESTHSALRFNLKLSSCFLGCSETNISQTPDRELFEQVSGVLMSAADAMNLPHNSSYGKVALDGGDVTVHYELFATRVTWTTFPYYRSVYSDNQSSTGTKQTDTAGVKAERFGIGINLGASSETSATDQHKVSVNANSPIVEESIQLVIRYRVEFAERFSSDALGQSMRQQRPSFSGSVNLGAVILYHQYNQATGR